MADLTYSVTALQDTGRRLTDLSGVLHGAGRRIDADADEMGHPDVVSALRHFAGNWDDKRELLCRSLEAVGSMAGGAAETLRDADDELAAKIREAVE